MDIGEVLALRLFDGPLEHLIRSEFVQRWRRHYLPGRSGGSRTAPTVQETYRAVGIVEAEATPSSASGC